MLHSGIELSKIPARFSSYKIPSRNALHLLSAFFSICHSKRKGPGVGLPARLVVI